MFGIVLNGCNILLQHPPKEKEYERKLGERVSCLYQIYSIYALFLSCVNVGPIHYEKGRIYYEKKDTYIFYA